MTKDELFAAVDIVTEDYRDMLVHRAMWDAWHEGLASFGVLDGKVVMYVSDEQAQRAGLDDPAA